MDEIITGMLMGTEQTDSLMISMPPRHGKSEYISKWLPTYWLGKRPNDRIINCGYGNSFAKSWGRKCRDLFAEHGRAYFGLSVSDTAGAANEWNVAGHEGGMLTAGIGGGITGRGANLLIVDDPVKDAEEALSETYRDKIWDWWQSTSDTRLEPGAKKIVVMTRWHIDDLAGRLIAQSEETGEAWRVINFPAIAEFDDPLGRNEGEALWPERWPIEALERKRRGRSTYWWNALYQGRPGQHDDAEFPAEYFEPPFWVDEMPEAVDMGVVFLDASKGKDAKKGDFQASVFVGVYEGKAYVDAILGRWPISKAVSESLRLLLKYRGRVLAYESNNFQEEAVGFEIDRQLAGNRLHGLTVVPVNHQMKKELRIQRLDAYLRAHELRFVRSPGTKMLVDQLREFPHAAHDDGPDALEEAVQQCLSMLNPACAPDPVADILAARGHI